MKVTYNLAIYPRCVLLDAIEAYKHHTRIKMSQKGSDSVVLDFLKCAFGMTETINEFNNYMIELLNVSGQYDSG